MGKVTVKVSGIKNVTKEGAAALSKVARRWLKWEQTTLKKK